MLLFKAEAVQIKGFAAARAKHGGLLTQSIYTFMTKRGIPSARQRSPTDPAIGWKESCYQIVYDRPNQLARTLQHAGHSAPLLLPTGWSSRRSSLGSPERIVYPALAEDAPHSQQRIIVPMPKV